MMYKTILLGTALLLLAAIYFFDQPPTTDTTENNTEVETASETPEGQNMTVARDAVFGYEFWYEGGEDGYITLEYNESTHPDFVSGMMLMNRAEYELLQASTDAREGPPAMHLRIYTNPANLHAPVWAMRNPSETNYGLMRGTETEAVVGGANATHFTADGLYLIDTYVVANGEHIYVLTGAYREPNDEIHQDFQSLIASFNFIAPTEPAG